MKRKMNESGRLNRLISHDYVDICVSAIRNFDDTMDCNKLRDIFVEEGAVVEGHHGWDDGEPATFMRVSDLPEDEIVKIL